MINSRKGLGYTPDLLVPLAIILLVIGVGVPVLGMLRKSAQNQKISQPETFAEMNNLLPSPEVFQKRQEEARQRAIQRKIEEELETQQQQQELEKENAVYEITFIQIDRELNFSFYILRHKRNNTEYLLVVTPEGSSISPLQK